ncbi:DUF2642 domain-containing protein [Limnochorda pilosa]|uniref:Uncharacterized protein n=1 Tax=Limnochorda pilosa TaxID=1555112 RepID=A0A0K2SL18_LIMPI|nr:DUF2642 domain-containing protein [Limnochorda pilosa]BAS27808.1 hypothetical protein LIP_1967 [Limnochorda pilosa]
MVWRSWQLKPSPGTGTFAAHMAGLVNREVEVATTCGRLAGTVAAAFRDHLVLLDGRRVRHHVRYEEICWVREGRSGAMEADRPAESRPA